MISENLLYELDALHSAAERVFGHRQFVLGPEVKDLEQLLAELFHTRHAIGCNSGFGAHLLTLIALGIGPDARVAVPAFGPYSFAGALLRRRATPVFVDIARGEFAVDVNALSHVSETTEAAVCHDLFYGSSSLDILLKRVPTLPIVRVATHSFSGLLNAPPNGSHTVTTTLCLRDTATLGAPGDAGLILTNDDFLADRLRYIRSELNIRGEHQGFESGNFHQDTLHAAFLLKVLNQRLAAVRTRTEQVGELLESLRRLGLTCIHIPQAAISDCTYPVIYATHRDSLLQQLQKEGLQAKIWWSSPIHLQQGFHDLGYSRGSFPNSERAAVEHVELSLPSSKSEYDLLVSILVQHCSVVQSERRLLD